MKKTYLQKGFTLIELLVVIAIIGILSSVVLASLNTARGKGSNAAIKGDLNNIRAQAELYYDDQTPNSYGTYAFGNCTPAPTTSVFSNTNVKQALAHALSLSVDITVTGSKCVSDGNNWAALVLLKAPEGSNNAWCVDSSGQSKAVSVSIPSGAYTISASDLICG